MAMQRATLKQGKKINVWVGLMGGGGGGGGGGLKEGHTWISFPEAACSSVRGH